MLRVTPTLREIRKARYYDVLNAEPAFRVALVGRLGALHPPDRSTAEWLLRPDFDWSEPIAAVEWARDSSRKLGMAASMRLVQALAMNPDEDSRQARHAMRLIYDSEAQEQAAIAALEIVDFCAVWPLPADAAEDLAHSYVGWRSQPESDPAL